MPLFAQPNNSANLIATKNALDRLYRGGPSANSIGLGSNGGYASQSAARGIEKAYRQPSPSRLPLGSNISGEGIRQGSRSAAAQAAAAAELRPGSLTGQARAAQSGARNTLRGLQQGAKAKASGLLGAAGAGATGRATRGGLGSGGALARGIANNGLAVGGGVLVTASGLASGQGVGRSVGAGVGSAAGSIAGAKAGAAAGAAIGSAVAPGPGTAIGAAVGGVVGSVAGGVAGQAAGAAIGGTLDPSQTGPVPSPEGHTTPGPAPFEGGQSPGVLYFGEFTYRQRSRENPAGLVRNGYTWGLEGPLAGTSYAVPNPYGFRHAGVINKLGDGRVLVAINSNTSWVTDLTLTNIRRADGQPDTGGNPTGPPQRTPAVPAKRSPTGAAPLSGGIAPGRIPGRAGAPGVAPAPSGTPAATPSGTPAATPAATPESEGEPKPDTPTFPFPPIIPAIGKTPSGSPANTAQPSGANQNGSGGDGKKPPGKSKGNCGSKCSAGLTQALENLGKKQESMAADVAALAGQGAELGLLTIINNKLGPQIPNGGIGGLLKKTNEFMEKAWKTTGIDKVLNALNTILLLHNAAMLSRSLASSLGELATQALSVFGIQDAEGSPLDVNAVLGKAFKETVKDLVGDDIYSGVTTTWAKSSAIMSSASNIIWTVRSLADSSQAIAEWTAEHTGKIGNALKKWRVVGENAYKWMPEKVRGQSPWERRIANAREGVESLDDAASSLSSVLGDVQNIQQEFQQLGEQRTAFETAVQAFEPQAREDNTPVKEKRDKSLEESKSPELTVADQQRGDQEGN